MSGKKAKMTGEYRDGYYYGKWWVKGDMLCLDYARIDDFDDFFWIERLEDNKIKSYSRQTGAIAIEKIQRDN